MLRYLLIAFAVLALGTVLFTLTRSRADAPFAPQESGPSPGDVTENPARTSTREEFAEIEDASAPYADVEAPVRDGFLVEVLNLEDLQPLLADVFYLEPGDVPPRLQNSIQQSLTDILALARQFGRHFRTDLDGTTSVPKGSDSVILYGESMSGQRGMVMLEDAVGGRLRLLLTQPTDVEVRVVDRDGQPQPGVPVALVYRPSNDRPWQPLVQRRAPEPGALVRFDLVVGFFDQAPPGSEFAAALWVPVGELVHRRLELQDLPETPIVLTLPPAGALQVHALDSAGRRITSPGHVTISHPFADLPRSRLGPEEFREGVATFRHVGLGLELRASGTVAGSTLGISGAGPGPVVAGETAVLELRETVGRPVLSFRVLDSQGQPLAEAPLRLSFDRQPKSGGHSWSTSPVTSDSRGLIRTSIGNGSFAARTLSVWRSHAGQRFDLTASVRLDISEAYPPGETHLGDVRLEVAPVLVRGQVLDSRGEPVAEAQLLVTDMTPDPERPGRNSFRSMNESDGKSGADGRFEIRGWAEGPMLRVQAIKNGYVRPGFLECPRGTDGLEIRMQRGGSLVATFTEDSLTLLSKVRSRLDSPSDVPRARPRLGNGRLARRKGNTMTWNDLLPGTYDLSLRLPVGPEPILRVNGIQVEADEITRDPRAQDIDLTQSSREIEITVLDQDGEPVRRANIRQARGETWRVSSTDTEGRAILAVSPWGTEIEVSARGYRSESRSLVASDQVFNLRPGLVVRAQVNDLPTGLGEGVTVQVRLELEGRRGSVQLSPGETTSVPGPGTYTVRWRVDGPSPRGRDLRILPDREGSPQTVQIGDTPELQVLEIPFPREREAELRQLIRDLREGR